MKNVQLEIEVDAKGRGLLRGHFSGGVLDLLRLMPDRRRWVSRTLVFEMTDANVGFFKENLPDVVWSPDALQAVKKLQELRWSGEATAAAKKRDVLPDVKFTYKTKPFKHQEKAFLLSRDKASFALLMEMGTGKTKVVLDTAAYLYQRGKIEALVVIAPNNVHRQWAVDQIPEHLPDWCPRTVLVYGSLIVQSAGFRKDLKKWFEDDHKLRIMCVNIEGLSTAKATAFVHDILDKLPAMLVVDECTRIKTPGASRTKNAIRLSKLAPYKRIMSGSPVTKGAEDLYSPLAFLDPNILGFSSYWAFRGRHCTMGGWQGKQIVGYRNIEELQARLDGWSYRIRKADCLDLPEKVYVTVPVPLAPDQRAAYKELRDNFIVEIDGGMVEAAMAITRLLRLQQIVCGRAVTDAGVKRFIHSRVITCVDLVESASGKTIVWSRFLEDIDNISEELKQRGIGHITYDGRSKNRMDLVTQFRKDENCRVFVGQPASGGIGLNLEVANTVIYYSNDYNAEVRWQSEDRAHRIGQVNKVTYIDLVAPGTIDTKILAALKNKKNVAAMVVDPDQLAELLKD